MPIATILAQMLKAGKVTVSTNKVEAFEITAEDKEIDIQTLNKEILKDILAFIGNDQKRKGLSNSIKGTFGQIQNIRSNIGLARDTAQDLSQAGITVTLSYKGDVVVTIGSKAAPKLSSIMTGTKAIEINNPRKLVELGL